jgi:uncharacterized protein YbjT (DUF2867 family)
MRVFLAGATGVIGSRLLPRLLQDGHEVTAMTRSAERLSAAGAVAVLRFTPPALCRRPLKLGPRAPYLRTTRATPAASSTRPATR